MLKVNNGLSTEFIVLGYMGYQLFNSLGLTIYLRSLNGLNLKLDLTTLDKKRLSKFLNYSISNSLTYLGAAMTTKIDHFMISTMVSFQKSGVYAISQFVGNIIDIPAKSLLSITNPVISQKMSDGAMKEVKKIYHSSSMNLTILGVFMSLLIWSGLPILFNVTTKLQELWPGAQYIVAIIIFSKIINMMTSVNHQIISHSRYFRFNLWSMLALGCLNIILNIYLIPTYGIIGAAIASLISLSLINFSKIIFIKLKFDMWPLPFLIVRIIPVVIVALLVIFLLPNSGNLFIDGILRITIIIILYTAYIYKLKLAPELVQKVMDIKKKLF
jgi:O-antigen/teichoic acid export membrane protein